MLFKKKKASTFAKFELSVFKYIRLYFDDLRFALILMTFAADCALDMKTRSVTVYRLAFSV